MNKAVFFILLLTLMACGTKNSNKSVNGLTSKSSKTNIDTSVKSSVKDYEKLGFELMKNETLNNLKLGLKLEKLIQILGEPEEKTKNELWGADGEYHQTFSYNRLGIELDLAGKTDVDKTIDMITIKSPCAYKTSKGIGVGCKYKEVKQAYKDYINPDGSDPSVIVAGSVYGGVIFNFKNGIVESIFIGASAE